VSAGEASGDLHASRLVRALRELDGRVRVSCLGGPALARAGARVVVDNREMAVVGLFEVLRHLKTIHAAWRRLEAHLTRRRPAAVVLVDYPDFNFLLARLAAHLGIRILYYIGPQIWGWRRNRVYTLKRLVDRMIVILPFEKDFYGSYGMDVDYVGHPLLDILEEAPSREDSRMTYRPGPDDGGGAPGPPVVGLLPGSRRGEVRTLLPLLLEAAGRIRRKRPDARFLVPVAPALDTREVEKHAASWNLPLRLVEGDTHGVIRACDLILAASGTVTLEAAILDTPMIIVYRVSDLSYYSGRHLIKVSHVGLPNLVAGRPVAPELLQHDARPDKLAATALDFLARPEKLEGQRRELSAIRGKLGEPGVARRAARIVLDRVAAGKGRTTS